LREGLVGLGEANPRRLDQGRRDGGVDGRTFAKGNPVVLL
jgi:hypothetical protein